MSKLNDLERQFQALSTEELPHFRLWFAEFEARSRDHQIEADAASGKLDAFAKRARNLHVAGGSSKL